MTNVDDIIIEKVDNAGLTYITSKTTQFTCFDCVLQKRCDVLGVEIDPPKFALVIEPLLKARGAKYWAMLHDKDIDSNGETKTLHYHLVIQFSTRHTKGAVIKMIAQAFKTWKVKDRNGSILNGTSWIGVVPIHRDDLNNRIRYLMHLDDLDKESYFQADVLTNAKDYLMLCVAGGVTENLLISLVEENPSTRHLLRALGNDNYLKYWRIINDLRNIQKKEDN